MKNKKVESTVLWKNSENFTLTLFNCCINTSQMPIAKTDSPVCLLFKNVHFVGHFMNDLSFICLFVDITANPELILDFCL